MTDSWTFVDAAMDAADADLYAWNLEQEGVPGGALPIEQAFR